MASDNRPLSPHLQVHRWYLTMAMSILHRATGAALGIGSILLAWWLIAAATGPDYFALVQGFFASILGRLILFGFTWALMYHMLSGIRHLFWDTGLGFELDTARRAGIAVLVLSVLLTLVAWGFGYSVLGG